MSVEISPPFRVFTDVDGEPLEDGYIYVGAVNQNPQAVPISVFWDQALTIPAAQPIRTLGGYPSRSGTPSRMYVTGDAYSISVLNKNSTLIYSDLNNRAGDAGIKQDLENGTDPLLGAGLLGFGESVSYAAGTVGAKLQSIVYTPYAEGAVGDGVADDTAAVLAWAASTGTSNKHWGDGTFLVSDRVVFNAGDQVTGNGPNSILDCSAGIGAATECVFVTGSLVALPALGANVTLNAGAITFASAPDVEPGDVILIFNPTDSSWSTWRPDYRAGEFIRAGRISGSVVTTYGLTYDAYDIADVDIYKLVGKSTSFRDFTIKQPATSNAGLKVSLIDSPIVEDVETGGGVYSGVYLDRCYDIKVSARARQASAASGNNYGLVCGNCHGGTIDGRYYGTRHAISLGGASGVGSVTTRALTIRADQLGLEGNAAQDLHGNTEAITFMGGNFAGGQVGGKNNKWIGCNFSGRRTSGDCLVAGEVVEGTFEFIGCRFETVINPNASSLGIISLQNFSSDVKGAAQFLFSDTSIRAPSGTTYAILASFEGSAHDVSISFNGLAFLASPSITAVYRLRNSSGVYRTIQLKGVTGLAASGVTYATEVSAPTIASYKLPRQVGNASIPVTTAIQVASLVVPYGHTYPRAPKLIVHNANPTVGGDRIVSGYTVNSGLQFTAQVATADGAVWASNDTATVSWSAELDDL